MEVRNAAVMQLRSKVMAQVDPPPEDENHVDEAPPGQVFDEKLEPKSDGELTIEDEIVRAEQHLDLESASVNVNPGTIQVEATAHDVQVTDSLGLQDGLVSPVAARLELVRGRVEVLVGDVRRLILENESLLRRLDEAELNAAQLRAQVEYLEHELRREKFSVRRAGPALAGILALLANMAVLHTWANDQVDSDDRPAVDQVHNVLVEVDDTDVEECAGLAAAILDDIDSIGEEGD